MNCSRCQSQMEEGYPAWGPGSWVSGPPSSNWKDFRKTFLAAKNSIPITTYRCTKCGHLESFAQKA
jgi:hypothetical protein